MVNLWQEVLQEIYIYFYLIYSIILNMKFGFSSQKYTIKVEFKYILEAYVAV